MSAESPENKSERSEAEWQELKKEALYWRGMVRTTRDQGNGVSRSYNHILNNICASLTLVIETADTPEERKDEWYGGCVGAIEYIKRYFKLLEDFPDFSEKELKPGGGYFPEMMNILAGTREFIDAYEVKLRGPKNPGETE